MDWMNPEQLEKTVHAALRSLPLRQAPATLEARVLAEIARQASVPWWHKSYAYWPLGARVAFLAFCGGLAQLSVFAAIYVQAGFDAGQLTAAFGPLPDFAVRAFGVIRTGFEIGAVVVRNIPALWLYGAVAFVAGAYAMLFGLGAAAYRTLWAHR